MKRILTLAIALGLPLLLGACAHPINIAPDTTAIAAPAAAPSGKSVAYVISVADRDTEVTTPGGGGDSIRYFPYRELESGIFQALSSIYKRVTLWRSAAEKDKPESKDVALVFTPKISTGSSSTSIMTWPPTAFFITINYDVKDASGKQVYADKVLGRGAAEFEEFKADFGLAGKRASQEVLTNFKAQVEAAKELR